MHKLTEVPVFGFLLLATCSSATSMAAECARDIISSECTVEDPYVPSQGLESTMVEGSNQILESGNADPGLRSAIQTIQRLPADQQAEAYRALAFDELGMFNDMTGKLNRTNLQIMSERLSVIRDYVRADHTQKRRRASGAVYGELGAVGKEARPGAPGNNRLSTFYRFDYDMGGANRTDYQEGYDFDGYGFSLGIDYLFADSMILGLVVGTNSLKFDYDSPETSADVQTLQGTAYYSYFRNLWHIDAIATFTDGSTDMKRQIGTADQVLAKSEANDIKNEMLTLSLTGGYFLDYHSWAFELEGGVQHATNKVAGFRETLVEGDSGLMAEVDDFELKSTQLLFGVTTSYPYRYGQTVISPYLGGYFHSELQGNQEITTRFLGDSSGTVLPITTNDNDSLYGRFNIGVGTEISKTWRGFFNVATFVGLDDLHATAFSLGLSADF